VSIDRGNWTFGGLLPILRKAVAVATLRPPPLWSWSASRTTILHSSQS